MAAMKVSDEKLRDIRAIADACADALEVVVKASQDRQAKRQESRRTTSASQKLKTR